MTRKDRNNSNPPLETYWGRLMALIVLSIAGAGVSGYLSYHYYQVRSGMAGFKSFCNVGDTMNCDAVALSPYAELVGGLPLSSFGVAWFLTMAAIALLGRNVFWRRDAIRALFVMSAIGSALMAFYLAIMAFKLNTFCLFCLITDGITFASLALVLSMKPWSFKVDKPDLGKWKTFAGILAVISLLSILGLRGFDSLRIGRSTVNEYTYSVMTAPVVSVNAGDEFPSIGPKDAPITIVEFSDFQCPYCRLGAHILHAVQARFPGQVRIVLRNYPIDPACNSKVQHKGHPVACEAAKVVYCSNKQGKFAEVYEAVFENQAELAQGKPVAYAKSHGVDETQLLACMSAPETAAAINRDIEEGTQLGVSTTPTFFINGRKVQGAYPVPVWIEVINRLLAAK